MRTDSGRSLLITNTYFAGVFDGGETNEARLKPEVLEDTEGNRLNPKVGESLDIGRLGIGNVVL